MHQHFASIWYDHWYDLTSRLAGFYVQAGATTGAVRPPKAPGISIRPPFPERHIF